MAKQTATRVELYKQVNSPGKPIPINIDPKEAPDTCSEEADIREAVRGLRSGRTGSTRGLRAKHIKAWLRGIVRKEKKPEGNAGAGDTW